MVLIYFYFPTPYLLCSLYAIFALITIAITEVEYRKTPITHSKSLYLFTASCQYAQHGLTGSIYVHREPPQDQCADILVESNP